jgi:polar amino acid transport system substrate-binding protein
MRLQFQSVFVGLVMSMLSASCGAKEPIRFVVGTNWAPPYGEVIDNRLVGGILLDLATGISKVTGRAIEYVPLPRKRQELAGADLSFDIHCYFNPKWSEYPHRYDWSPPLFPIFDLLVSRSGATTVGSIAGLPKGTVVGTVLGYAYSDLEPFFQSGQLIREDAPDQLKVLLKVDLGRHAFGVGNSFAVDWFKRTKPGHRLSPDAKVIAEYGFHCAVPKLSAIPSKELFDALDALKKSGEIKGILRKYQ